MSGNQLLLNCIWFDCQPLSKKRKQKELCIPLWLQTKIGSWIISFSTNLMWIPGSRIHLKEKTEYSRFQDHALHLEGRTFWRLFWVVETEKTITNDRHWTKIMCFGQALKYKRLQKSRGTIMWDCRITLMDPMLQKLSRHTWKRLNAKSYPTNQTLQTLLAWNITCFDPRCITMLPSLPLLQRSQDWISLSIVSKNALSDKKLLQCRKDWIK